MKFFFDNNISPKFPRMLQALGEDAVALREEFPPDITDEVLLKKLRGRNVVFVSGDRKMRTGAVEAPLLRGANVTSLFFAPFWSKLLLWDQAAWLVSRWPKIRGFAEGADRGTCAEVKRNGRSMLFPL